MAMLLTGIQKWMMYKLLVKLLQLDTIQKNYIETLFLFGSERWFNYRMTISMENDRNAIPLKWITEVLLLRPFYYWPNNKIEITLEKQIKPPPY